MSKTPRTYTFEYVTALLNESTVKDNQIAKLRKALRDLYMKNISGFHMPDNASMGEAHVWETLENMFRDSDEQARAGEVLLEIPVKETL